MTVIVQVITVVTAAAAPAETAALAAAVTQTSRLVSLKHSNVDWHSQVELMYHYSVQVQQVSDVRFRQLNEGLSAQRGTTDDSSTFCHMLENGTA